MRRRPGASPPPPMAPQTCRKCAKIIGPGSPWVAAAKRLLADVIDTGTPAGPSESIVLADDTADGRLAALDLLIESEHGPDSSAYLVTWSRARRRGGARAPSRTIGRRWASSASASRRRCSCGPRGGIVLAPRPRGGDRLRQRLCAGASRDPVAASRSAISASIDHAGEILLGEHTPVTLGNFVLGPNHVLPTGGWARTASPLSVFDFMKRTSVGYVTAAGYPRACRATPACSPPMKASTAMPMPSRRCATGRGRGDDAALFRTAQPVLAQGRDRARREGPALRAGDGSLHARRRDMRRSIPPCSPPIPRARFRCWSTATSPSSIRR